MQCREPHGGRCVDFVGCLVSWYRVTDSGRRSRCEPAHRASYHATQLCGISLFLP
jgi:hypothetical protein